MIKNKKGSIEFLIKHNLNRIESTRFYDIFDILLIKNKEIKDFLDKHEVFSIRSSKAAEKFFHHVTFTWLSYNMNLFYDTNEYQLVESLYEEDRENMLSQIEICIDENYLCNGWINRKRGMTHREAVSNSSVEHFYNIGVELLKKHKYAKEPVNYCLNNNLINKIVELSFYNVPVGINKENVLIWEVRNY